MFQVSFAQNRIQYAEIVPRIIYSEAISLGIKRLVAFHVFQSDVLNLISSPLHPPYGIRKHIGARDTGQLL